MTPIASMLSSFAIFLILNHAAVHSFVPIERNNKITAFTTKLRASSISTPTTTIPKQSQILTFQEPKTNVTVVLVGAMHYNPASIQLTKDTITSLGDDNKLGSVIIESCDIRYNKTLETYKEQPFFTKILKSEMSTASDLTIKEYKRPVILGDQRINVTGIALKSGLKDALTDALIPITGWKRFYDTLKPAFDDAVPTGPQYLNAKSIFDMRLLLATPVSFLKYPLSYLVRSPISTMVGLSFLFLLNALDPTSSAALDSAGETSLQVSDYAGSLAFAFFETAVFGRILVKELLAERNEILAKNVLEQCKIYAKKSDDTFFGLKLPLFLQEGVIQDKSEIVYVPDSNLISNSESNGEKVVVAVLGMAHCNGIMKLLMEERI